jgi:hypothetical protein
MKHTINGRTVYIATHCGMCGMHPCGLNHVCDPDMIKLHAEYLKKQKILHFQEVKEMLEEI